MSRRFFRALGSIASVIALIGAETAVAQAAMDPHNPTCPTNLNFSTYREMRLTPQNVNGQRVLLAEGAIDDNLIPRLQAALDQNQDIGEIWLRSPGGNARVGNEAGLLIRRAGMVTRIPSGWACFSACNFMFMGGAIRYVDDGGLFIVHMFTHTHDRDVIRSGVDQGVDSTANIIGGYEQDSALLASEDNDFLIRMGISRLLLTEVMYQQPAVGDAQNPTPRRCLTQAEVNRYYVATVPWQGPPPSATRGGVVDDK